MFIFGYLQGQTLAYITGQADIQSCTLENVIDEAGGGGLSVRTGDADHLGIRIASGKFYFRDNRCALFFQFQNQRSIVWNTRAFNYLVGIQNQFFGMMAFFPGNTVAVEQFFVLVLDGGHVRYERLESFHFG